MLPFREYKSLPFSTEEVSLQLWVDELLVQAGERNINQLGKYLIRMNPQLFTQKYHSKYFYKKKGGQPIRAQQFPLKLDEELPGTAKVLFSPLWPLLERSSLSTREAQAFISCLPRRIARHLVTRDLHHIKWDINAVCKLSTCTSLDALIALLIIFLNKREKLPKYTKSFIYQQIARMVIRLFSIRYHSYAAGWYLVQKLNAIFKEIDGRLAYVDFVLWENEKSYSFHLPIELKGISCMKQFQAICLVHARIAIEVGEKLSLQSSDAISSIILACLDYDNLHELAWNLHQNIKIHNLQGSNTELFKLNQRIEKLDSAACYE